MREINGIIIIVLLLIERRKDTRNTITAITIISIEVGGVKVGPRSK